MNRGAAFQMSFVLVAPLGVACASASTAPPAKPASVVAISVSATDFAFTPSTIRVPLGKPVRIQMPNSGVVDHDLRVDLIQVSNLTSADHEDGHGHGGAAQVMAHSAPGKTGWVEFTPTKPGTYELVCTITGHKDAGMKGTLIVE